MARGNLYKIETKTYNILEPLNKREFYDMAGYDCNYVELSSNDSALTYLTDMLTNAGMPIRSIPITNADKLNIDPDDIESVNENTHAVIQPMSDETLDKCKMKLFEARMETAKNYFNQMTLHDFATKTEKVSYLQSLIADNYDDMVYSDGSRYIMDDFLRNLRPNTAYFIHASTLELN